MKYHYFVNYTAYYAMSRHGENHFDNIILTLDKPLTTQEQLEEIKQDLVKKHDAKNGVFIENISLVYAG